jgi:sulfur carrier protein
MPAGMEVSINGRPHQLAADMTVADAVLLLTSSAAGVAAALNGEVVRRAAWSSTALAPGDRVEVLTAVQGG